MPKGWRKEWQQLHHVPPVLLRQNAKLMIFYFRKQVLIYIGIRKGGVTNTFNAIGGEPVIEVKPTRAGLIRDSDVVAFELGKDLLKVIIVRL